MDSDGEAEMLGPGSATRSSLMGLGSSLVIVLANLVSGVITARLLGPEGRAVVITATVWTIVGSWVALVGLRQSMQYHLAPIRRRALSASMAASGLVLVTLLAAVGVLVAQGLVGLVISDRVLLDPTRVMLGAIVVVAWYEAVCAILLGRHHVGTAVILRTSQPVIYVLLLVGATVVSDLTAEVTLACLAISFLLPAAAGLVLAVRTGGLARPRLGHARVLLAYGARAYPGSLATLTNARIDLLVIPAVLAPAAVGFYGVASNTSGIMQQLLGNLALVLFPAMAASDPGRRRDLLERTVRLLLVIGIVGACVGSVLAAPLIALLYGAEFDSTVPLLRVLLFASVAYSVMGVLTAGMAANGMPMRASLVNFIGVPATVTGLLVLVPTLGAEGAALTSLGAYGLCMVAGFLLCPRDLLQLRQVLSPRQYRSDTSVLLAKLRGIRRRG